MEVFRRIRSNRTKGGFISMENKPLRVAIYCRVANADQLAADNQAERLRRFVEELGVNDPLLYMDNGYSGLDFGRPGFSKLSEDIRAGSIRALVALEQSRIARNYFLYSTWEKDMQDRGVRLIYANHADNEVQAIMRQSLSDAWRKKNRPPNADE